MKNLILIALSMALLAAVAHEVDCPVCKLTVKQNTDKLDYEVVLRFGNKKIEYRCVNCALVDSGRYNGDILIYAPSEKKGEPVPVRRKDGQWSAPEGSVFLNAFKKHADCADLSRGFWKKEALDAYVAELKPENAKALTIDQLLAEIKRQKEGA